MVRIELLATFVHALERTVRYPLNIDTACRISVRRRTQTVEKEIVMNSGVVKWFNGTKGFGFIQPDDGSTDVFVHISAVERAGMRELVEGQKIRYDLVRDKKSGKNSADNLQAA